MLRLSSSNNIIFFGAAEFAAPVLELLVKNGWPVKLTVTQPDRPIGRHQKPQPPPVKITAQKLGLKLIQLPKLNNWKLEIGKLVPSPPKDWGLFVICAYGKILPAELLKIPKFGAINIHPSLLPKYRGPSPVQTAILNGETQTGVSVMLLDEKMDHGPILAQKTIAIGKEETYPELSTRLAKIGAGLLLETLPGYLAGKIKPRPQNHARATFTKILVREDGRIDWSRPAQEIYNQWRAFQPWPGTYKEQRTKSGEQKIKLLKVAVSNLDSLPDYKTGEFVKLNKKELGVVCGDGKILVVERLQPEGKKAMTAEEFINGYKIFLEPVSKK